MPRPRRGGKSRSRNRPPETPTDDRGLCSRCAGAPQSRGAMAILALSRWPSQRPDLDNPAAGPRVQPHKGGDQPHDDRHGHEPRISAGTCEHHPVRENAPPRGGNCPQGRHRAADLVERGPQAPRRRHRGRPGSVRRWHPGRPLDPTTRIILRRCRIRDSRSAPRPASRAIRPVDGPAKRGHRDCPVSSMRSDNGSGGPTSSVAPTCRNHQPALEPARPS